MSSLNKLTSSNPGGLLRMTRRPSIREWEDVSKWFRSREAPTERGEAKMEPAKPYGVEGTGWGRLRNSPKTNGEAEVPGETPEWRSKYGRTLWREWSKGMRSVETVIRLRRGLRRQNFLLEGKWLRREWFKLVKEVDGLRGGTEE